MKFWKNFLDMLKNFFYNILSKTDAASELICEEIRAYSFAANDDPIKTISLAPVKILSKNADRHNLIVQNIGSYPCRIHLGEGISTDNFHSILAADIGENQGNGGSIELKNWHGSVYALCEKETKVSVLEY